MKVYSLLLDIFQRFILHYEILEIYAVLFFIFYRALYCGNLVCTAENITSNVFLP